MRQRTGSGLGAIVRHRLQVAIGVRLERRLRLQARRPGAAAAVGSSSSAMPFLKLLMPLATSPIMSEKRPLPNNSSTMTPTTSQCQMLKPPMIISLNPASI